MSHLDRLSAAGCVLAAVALICTPATVAAILADPAFEVRDRRPEISARTLELVRTSERPPVKLWVYFTDKNVFDSEILTARLSEVREALGTRAAARRAKVLPGLVDYHDLPLHGAYVDQLETMGATVRRRSRWLNAVSVEAPLVSLERIAALAFVQKIVPVAGAARTYPEIPRTGDTIDSAAPEPRAAGAPFNYGSSLGQNAEINAIAAHDLGLSGAGVRIASFDTGFQHIHETFSTIISEGRLIAQYDFVNDDGETMNETGDDTGSHTHGTITWSAMAGFTEGELIGPAFGAEFLLAKTEDITSETEVEEDNWCAAAEWADASGADIITSSLGYLDWYTYADMDGVTAPITQCAELAVTRGILVVTSAGNAGNDPWFYITAPADGEHVVTVGAVNAANQVASFSSRGPTYDQRTKPEVVARGVATRCAIPPNPDISYGSFSGTSLSCPLVAGAAALILEQNPTWTPAQVRHSLMLTADTATNPDNERGWGRIDVIAAMLATVAVPGAMPAPARTHLVAAPNPFETGTVLDVSLEDDRSGVVEIFDTAGRRLTMIPLSGGATSLAWNARDRAGRPLAPGVYLARLRSGEWRSSVKLVLKR